MLPRWWDPAIHGYPTLDDVDGWQILAFAHQVPTPLDGRGIVRQDWYAGLDVHKDFVAHGWNGLLIAFSEVQRRLTRDAPSFDPSTIEWEVRPIWAFFEEHEIVEGEET